MTTFQDLTKTLDKKIDSLITTYESQLADEVAQFKHKLSNETWAITDQIEAHKTLLLGKFETLMHHIKQAILDELRHQHMNKSARGQAHDYLLQKITPLKKALQDNYQKIVGELVKEGVIEGFIRVFDSQLGRLLIQSFTRYAQELDDI